MFKNIKSQMRQSFVKQLLKEFPFAKETFEKDLKLARKDHPGYNEIKLYEELYNRYNLKRKQMTTNKKFV